MSDDITVVKVEDASRWSRQQNTWRVYFSEPVTLRAEDPKRLQDSWYADTPTGGWLHTDELGAFQWALKVIEKHKERVAREKHDEDR